MRSSYRSYQDRTFRFRALLIDIFQSNCPIFLHQALGTTCCRQALQDSSTGLQELPLLEEESNSLFLMLRGMTTATWLYQPILEI